MVSKTIKMTRPEQIHEINKRIGALADYWNRASVERCDIFKAIQLNKYDDLGFLHDMLQKHCKISIEIVASIEEFMRDMHVIDCCRGC